MRILLASNASYVPPRGGATRSNLIWLNYLARAGHACRIVCGPAGAGAALPPEAAISVEAVAEPPRRAQALRTAVREFAPDWVLISSEDLGHNLLREAHYSAADRVVYLAHTPQFFPFGPASWNPERPAAELVARSAGIVAIGRHMAGYIERELSRPAAVIHPPIYGSGPYPQYANAGRGMVTMINPCAVKGISIFLDVAARLPGLFFGALPGWGTTAEDLRALERLENVRILPHAPSIEDVLSKTRMLLMPSLWYEGFGLIAMEAMLHGIPVVASDAGGLTEAKQGTGYRIPVRGIERYQPVFDEQGMPKPVIEANDPAPWVEAVRELSTDEAAWQRESQASREAALAFVGALDAGEMERYLAALRPASSAQRQRATIESLSPEKRALLLECLRRRG